MPDELTVANSSCLIGLEAIGRREILSDLYESVLIPEAVESEVGGSLPKWFDVRTVANTGMVQALQLQLGDGEAEAIVLASELSATRLILDDRKARRIAQQMGLPVTGTLAVLLRAKQQGLLPAVSDVIDELRGVHFHVSDDLVAEVLRRAGELHESDSGTSS